MKRVIATTTSPSAPIRLSIYAGGDLVASVDLGPRQALVLAEDLLALAARKLPADAPPATNT